MDNVPQSAAAVSSAAPAVNSYLSSDVGQTAGLVNDIYTQLSGVRDYDNAWSAEQAEKQRAWSAAEAEKSRAYNSEEAAKNRNWQEMMSNTAHQREVQDLLAAGLNPVLSALNGNGASVTSGATASASNPTGAAASGSQNTGMAIASILGTIIGQQTKLEEQRLNAELNRELTDRQLAANEFLSLLANETSRLNAQTSVGAQMYGADRANEASRYSSELLNEASHYGSNKSYQASMYNTTQNALSAAAQRRLTRSENAKQRDFTASESKKAREHDSYIHRTFPNTPFATLGSISEGVAEILKNVPGSLKSAKSWIEDNVLSGDNVLYHGMMIK